MIVVHPSELDTPARLERPVEDNSLKGAGSGGWELVDEIWIGMRDQLPSRGEQITNGFNTASRRTRIRMYWRDDVTPAMRLVTEMRTMQIITPPAELGRRSGLELMAEDYLPAGNPA